MRSQILEQLAFLRVDLRGRRQVLKRTAAADSEVRAPRRDAVRRGRLYVDQTGFVELPAALHHPKSHVFARQCAFDEDGLAADARHAPTIVGQVHDVGFFDITERQSAGHAAANSLRWAAGESRSKARTRSTS